MKPTLPILDALLPARVMPLPRGADTAGTSFAASFTQSLRAADSPRDAGTSGPTAGPATASAPRPAAANDEMRRADRRRDEARAEQRREDAVQEADEQTSPASSGEASEASGNVDHADSTQGSERSRSERHRSERLRAERALAQRLRAEPRGDKLPAEGALDGKLAAGEEADAALAIDKARKAKTPAETQPDATALAQLACPEPGAAAEALAKAARPARATADAERESLREDEAPAAAQVAGDGSPTQAIDAGSRRAGAASSRGQVDFKLEAGRSSAEVELERPGSPTESRDAEGHRPEAPDAREVREPREPAPRPLRHDAMVMPDRLQAPEAAGSRDTPVSPLTSVAAQGAAISALSSASTPGAGTSPALGGTPVSTVTERAIAAEPGSPDFSRAIGAQVSMWASEGTREARLQLNPAELGPVLVHITLEGLQARVDFHAHAAATRDAIEASLPALAGALSEQGLTLSGGGVFDRDNAPRDQDAPPPEAGRRGARSDEDGDVGDRRAASTRPAARIERRGLVDLMA